MWRWRAADADGRDAWKRKIVAGVRMVRRRGAARVTTYEGEGDQCMSTCSGPLYMDVTVTRRGRRYYTSTTVPSYHAINGGSKCAEVV
jgi:hypothetical protein